MNPAIEVPQARPARGPWPRVFAILGAITLILASVFFAVGTVLQRQMQQGFGSMAADAQTEALRKDRLVPPHAALPDAVTCGFRMTEACARAAAGTSGIPVAWLPTPDGYTFGYLLAFPFASGVTEWVAVQTRGPVIQIQVSSGNGALTWGSKIGTLTQDEVTANLLEATTDIGSDSPFVTGYEIVWSRRGVDYELTYTAEDFTTALTPADRTRVEAMWRTIRYTVPSR